MTGPNFRETNDNSLDHDRHLARNLGQPGNPKRVRKDSWKERQVVNPYHAAKTRLRNKPDRVEGSCKAGKVVKVKNASKAKKVKKHQRRRPLSPKLQRTQRPQSSEGSTRCSPSNCISPIKVKFTSCTVYSRLLTSNCKTM